MWPCSLGVVLSVKFLYERFFDGGGGGGGGGGRGASRDPARKSNHQEQGRRE